MGGLLLTVLLYLLVPPLLVGLLGLLKRQVKYLMRGGRRSNTRINRNQEEVKETLNSKVQRRLSFVVQEDKRKSLGVSNKLMFFIIYFIGMGIALIGTLIGKNIMVIIALIFPYIAVLFAYKVADNIINERNNTVTRMLSLKAERMGLVSGGKTTANPNEEIKILDWGEDYLTPRAMHLYMPTRFDPLAVENFMTQFNTLFGFSGQWVANAADEKYPGFDFKSGVASLVATAQLPQRADWSAGYVLNDDIAWSFFPMALGSENGVLTKDPETGEPVHVLGFDLHNEQVKLAKKRGLQIGPEITAAPQVLIAGGTGGGKALASDTKVEVIED